MRVEQWIIFAPAPALTLSQSQQSQIEALLRNGGTPQRRALRGRIILLAQQGLANHAIAQQLNVSRPTVLAMRAIADCAQPGASALPTLCISQAASTAELISSSARSVSPDADAISAQ